jgi:hypothetical protein
MKKEKIYEFAIDRPLTPAKRKAVEKHIEENAHLSPKPVSYSWDEDDSEVLHITAEPVLVEVRFQAKNVELYATAPLWARLLFTKQRKIELKDQIESILKKVKFVAAGKVTPPKAKAATTRKSSSAQAKAATTRKSAPVKTRSREAQKPKPTKAKKSTARQLKG